MDLDVEHQVQELVNISGSTQSFSRRQPSLEHFRLVTVRGRVQDARLGGSNRGNKAPAVRHATPEASNGFALPQVASGPQRSSPPCMRWRRRLLLRAVVSRLAKARRQLFILFQLCRCIRKGAALEVNVRMLVAIPLRDVVRCVEEVAEAVSPGTQVSSLQVACGLGWLVDELRSFAPS